MGHNLDQIVGPLSKGTFFDGPSSSIRRQSLNPQSSPKSKISFVIGDCGAPRRRISRVRVGLAEIVPSKSRMGHARL